MNGSLQTLQEIGAMAANIPADPARPQCILFPPFTLLSAASALAAGSALEIGGQDCSLNRNGASTGDISATMIAEFGTAVILGHSERRVGHSETSALVAAKCAVALEAGLNAIVCVGETLDERKAGETLDVVKLQLQNSIAPTSDFTNTIIAYEPVWAIGTGLTPSLDEIEVVHRFVRSYLIASFGEAGWLFRILYGGSMKPSNAAEILAIENVNGGLIGGASLMARDFLSIYDLA